MIGRHSMLGLVGFALAIMLVGACAGDSGVSAFEDIFAEMPLEDREGDAFINQATTICAEMEWADWNETRPPVMGPAARQQPSSRARAPVVRVGLSTGSGIGDSGLPTKAEAETLDAFVGECPEDSTG